ncbi:ATP-dependent DNA helicase RecG [bacterium]|nr:ATP-dependent DNA helicase RecG [bacterium]
MNTQELLTQVESDESSPLEFEVKDGIIWVKNGANKRKVTSNEELARLLQVSGYLYAEEALVPHSTLEDLNRIDFFDFYRSQYNEEPDEKKLEHYVTNLRLGQQNKLNVAGALLFGKDVRQLLPQFFINAIWFFGDDITDNQYRSSENIYGTLDRVYKKSLDFLVGKLEKVQPKGRGFNSLGELEIPEIVLTEILVNALVHRDYFINDSIKIFLFENRIEMSSPGSLPNNLTEEQVTKGIRRTRNTIISSLAPYKMEYRGAGSGLLRAIKAYPHIQLRNEKDQERVVVTIERTNRSKPRL